MVHMAKPHPVDPQIRVTDALAAYDGIQARLAEALGINRASVHEWITSGVEHVPALQAHRLAVLRPELVTLAEQQIPPEAGEAA